MSDALQITLAGAGDAKAWDSYVRTCPHSTMFHLFGWRDVIRSTYGYGSVYLTARRGERIVGVAPFIYVRSPIFGRSLISTAFTVGGGILADSDEIKTKLANAAIEAGTERRVQYVELRSARAGIDDWIVKDTVYAGFEKELQVDADENLKAIPRKRRAEVRKAIAALDSGELTWRVENAVEPFYGLYAHAVRDHGTPIFPKRFVTEILNTFPGDTEVLQIEAAGEPVLALLSFYFRDTALPYFFGAGPQSRAHRAFDLSIWLNMRRGVERGCSRFDFGRSKFGTGSYAFKEHWGFEARALEYQYALIEANTMPNVSPTNPKFGAFVKIWKRLPLPVATLAGPYLARHLA